MADTEVKVVDENNEKKDVDEPIAKKQKLDESAELKLEVDGDAKPTLEKEIVEQIEYYFGDSNLYRDKFMQAEIEKNEGWIPFTTLLTFKRLSALSSDVEVIVDSLAKSLSDILEISEDRAKVRRNPSHPLPERNEETRKEIISRTAYVKGFSTDLEMPELLEFFKPYDKVSHIVIRKYLDKPNKLYKSKGSIFVTFQTKDQCASFLSQDVKYNDTELITKWQCDYYADKKTERQEKKVKNSKPELTISLPKGAVLRLTGIPAEVTRDVIKEQIESLGGEVAFVDFRKGDADGYVRLTTENAAQAVVEKAEEGTIKLADESVAIKPLEGEEEVEFLNNCVEKMKARRQHSGGKHRFNRKRRD